MGRARGCKARWKTAKVRRYSAARDGRCGRIKADGNADGSSALGLIETQGLIAVPETLDTAAEAVLRILPKA
jgi:hypothetical protein